MFTSTSKLWVCSVPLVVVLGSMAGCVDVVPAGGTPSVLSAERSCSSDTACVFDGILNRALGGAKLRLNADRHLMVENIGSSGLDGVRQFAIPSDTVLMTVGLACPNFVESVRGSKMVIIMYGNAPGETISSLTIENTDGQTIVADVDLSPVGVTLYTVEILNGDERVAVVRDLSSSRVIFTDPRDYVAVACGLHPNIGPNVVWIEYRLTIPGELIVDELGELFIGDTLRIKGQDQKTRPSFQNGFDNFFSNLPAVEMTYQSIDSVFKG